jgi:fructokinase
LFVSRVGHDADGDSVLRAMADWGMACDAVQRDTEYATGRVAVHLDNGQPSYDIVHPCAYDAIHNPGQGASGLLYHGSLALRDERSRAGFNALREASSGLSFLDVNLRAPWWDATDLSGWLRQADWVKLNDEELALLGPTGKTDVPAVEAMFERDGLRGLLVTYGADGAALMTREHGLVRVKPMTDIQVVDTVGAGDAFAAVCLLGILHRWPPATILERAQAFASMVVSQKGATCGDRTVYAPFIADWGLSA